MNEARKKFTGIASTLIHSLLIGNANLSPIVEREILMIQSDQLRENCLLLMLFGKLPKRLDFSFSLIFIFFSSSEGLYTMRCGDDDRLAKRVTFHTNTAHPSYEPDFQPLWKVEFQSSKEVRWRCGRSRDVFLSNSMMSCNKFHFKQSDLFAFGRQTCHDQLFTTLRFSTNFTNSNQRNFNKTIKFVYSSDYLNIFSARCH